MTFLFLKSKKTFIHYRMRVYALQISYTTRIRFLGPRKRVASVLFGEYPDLASSNYRTFPYAKKRTVAISIFVHLTVAGAVPASHRIPLSEMQTHSTNIRPI